MCNRGLNIQILSACLVGFLICLLAPIAQASSAAVVLMYHRFGERDFPSTNITTKQLDEHIAELTSGKYVILSLKEIVSKLIKHEPLPKRTVGISIDDGYESIFTIAWPRFRAAGLPFTVFLATGHIDQRSSRHLSWKQIREMRDSGVDFGHHTVSHLHMPNADEKRIEVEIKDADQRFKTELGVRPDLFAYPYGEASLSVVSAIKGAGFSAAFGQHSGVIASNTDLFYLPRFSMNETYGDIDRLRLAINALPLTVQDVTPEDHLITDINPPSIGFTVIGNMGNLDRLSCFLSHIGRGEILNLGSRIEVRTSKKFPKGRTRLNCTMPTASKRWRWYGRQFFVK